MNAKYEPQPLCNEARSHMAEGCMFTNDIVWESVSHVRNFHGETREDCIWACKDLKPGGIALTSKTEFGLSCTCGSLSSISSSLVFASPVCSLLDLHASLYSVSCQNSLKEIVIYNPIILLKSFVL